VTDAPDTKTTVGIVRTIGRKFPTLTFRLAALDDGDEYPYLASCTEGAFAEEHVEATEQFAAEVEGGHASRKMSIRNQQWFSRGRLHTYVFGWQNANK
jgi:hypothetical protein